MNADLAMALSLADVADQMSLRRFGAHDLVVTLKSDSTPVSDADRDIERALRDRLAEQRPGDAVLGEEFGDGRAGPDAAGRQWIIDPIDGTKNYVRGVPVFATLIAIRCAGTVEAGVVSAPALGRRWWAARGEGAFVGGRPMRVSAVDHLADAFVSYDSLSGFGPWGLEDSFRSLLASCGRSRAFGDFWSHMLVAEGAIDIAVEPEVSIWDVAAVSIIVAEAGGRFTDLSGVDRCDGGSAVSTNGRLHGVVLDSLEPRSGSGLEP